MAKLVVFAITIVFFFLFGKTLQDSVLVLGPFVFFYFHFYFFSEVHDSELLLCFFYSFLSLAATHALLLFSIYAAGNTRPEWKCWSTLYNLTLILQRLEVGFYGVEI